MTDAAIAGNAFDKKNQEDFDRNTEVITNGLMAIASNGSIKATAAELSRITGIHRNTLRQRIWPLQRLKAIKENRVIEEIRRRQTKAKAADPISVLTSKLEASRREVLHWFGMYHKANDRADQSEARVNFIKDAIPRLEAARDRKDDELLELRGEIARLRQVIDVLQSEQAEKSL